MHLLHQTSKIIGSILFKYQRSHSFTGVNIQMFGNFAYFSSIKDDIKADDDIKGETKRESLSQRKPQGLNKEKIIEMKNEIEMEKKEIEKKKMEIELEKKDIEKKKIEIELEKKDIEKKRMEEDEKKKKEEDEKKKEEEIKRKNDRSLLVGVIGLFITVPSFCYYLYQYYFKQYFIKKQFGSQSMDGETYLDGKYVETQIQTILDSKKIRGSITLLMGVPGIGKTVALKKYIKKQREKGRTVYYFNLRNREKKKGTEAQKLIFLMESVLDDQEGKDPEKNTDMFVIDDINIIEKFKDQQKGITIQNLCINLRMNGVTVVLVSSSTSFYYNIWKRQLISKSLRWQFLINEMKEDEFNQVLEKKAKQFGITNKNVIEKVKDLGQTIRFSFYCLQKIQYEDQTKSIQFINSMKTENQEQYQKIIKEVLHKKNQPLLTNNFRRKIIGVILSFKAGSDVMANSHLLYEKIQQCGKQLKIDSVRIQQVMTELDNKNLVIFGAPRNQAIRRAMENYLKKLEEEQRETQKEPKKN